jgi:hypothetical protein
MTQDRSQPPVGGIHFRVAYALLALLVMGVLVSLPFALAGIVGDIINSVNPVYELTRNQQAASSLSRVHLDVTAIDEWQRKATILVSGHHVCPDPCDHTDRFLFVAYPTAAEDGEGLPPYATITFDTKDDDVTQIITLPLSGEQIRYPFDVYELKLAVIMQRVDSDGTAEGMSPADAKGHFFLSAHAHLPRQVMSKPVAIPLNSLYVDAADYQYDGAWQMQFTRPLYLQVLTLLLLILTSTAAAYAVFLRPLTELVISVGALVIGIWGIRAILLGPDINGITIVDLWLSIVVLFLLTAISVRALHYLEVRSGVWVIRRALPQRDKKPAAAHSEQRPAEDDD